VTAKKAVNKAVNGKTFLFAVTVFRLVYLQTYGCKATSLSADYWLLTQLADRFYSV